MFNTDILIKESITILPQTKEAADEFGYGCGARYLTLSPEHLQALLDGKMLAWSDTEYSTFVRLEVKK
jgi:hypothetical protein